MLFHKTMETKKTIFVFKNSEEAAAQFYTNGWACSLEH
jgi:hypothetical protein